MRVIFYKKNIYFSLKYVQFIPLKCADVESVKVNSFTLHAGISPSVLNFSTRWSEFSASLPDNFTPLVLAPHIHLKGAQAGLRLSGGFGEEKIYCPCWKSNFDSPVF